MPQSLFERIGGESAVRATVMKLYDKLLSDAEVAPFFENVDVETLRRSQAAFVTYAFGGPAHYSGRGLRHAHAASVEKGLNDRHFDIVLGHLCDAMVELGVASELIAEARAIVESTRKDVLNK